MTGGCRKTGNRPMYAPYLKKGKRSDARNYRPVSLTSQCSKLLESIVRDEIVHHLDRFGLVSDSQHGFRRGSSCLSNILTFLDQAARWIDKGEAVDVLYLDFTKAFDKVLHRHLIDKLAAHSISGKIVWW